MWNTRRETVQPSIRPEWAEWKSNPRPADYCDGMRNANTNLLADSGFTPTLLTVSSMFLEDSRNKDTFLVSQLPGIIWDDLTVPFSTDLDIAIQVVEQFAELEQRKLCLWDRHGGNILVDPEEQNRVWQVDLETIFDTSVERFMHQSLPMTHQERFHLHAAKLETFALVHPINLQLQMVLLTLMTKNSLAYPVMSSEWRRVNTEIRAVLELTKVLRESKLSLVLDSMRNLQQRL